MKVQAMKRPAGTVPRKAVILGAALFGASMLAPTASAGATTTDEVVDQTPAETVQSAELREPRGSAADELYRRKWWPFPGTPSSGG